MNKLLLLCFLILTPVSLATADLKIAVIDLGKAFDSFYKTQDAQARLKEKQDGYMKDLQDMKTDYDHMGAEAQALQTASKDQTLSAEARAEKTKALQTKLQDLQTMQNKLEETKVERTRELQDEYMRRHKQIVDEIAKTITDYSGPQGYDLVIDKSSAAASSGVPYVLYNSSKLTDITADISALLNKSRPAAGATPAPASAPAPAPASH